MLYRNIRYMLIMFNTPLILAVRFNHKEIVELLLENEETDINAKDVCFFKNLFQQIIIC